MLWALDPCSWKEGWGRDRGAPFPLVLPLHPPACIWIYLPLISWDNMILVIESTFPVINIYFMKKYLFTIPGNPRAMGGWCGKCWCSLPCHRLDRRSNLSTNGRLETAQEQPQMQKRLLTMPWLFFNWNSCPPHQHASLCMAGIKLSTCCEFMVVTLNALQSKIEWWVAKTRIKDFVSSSSCKLTRLELNKKFVCVAHREGYGASQCGAKTCKY